MEIYEILIDGHLDDHWADWFDGLQIERKKAGHTILCGPVADQSALHGFLGKIRDLNLTLLSLKCVARSRPPPDG